MKIFKKRRQGWPRSQETGDHANFDKRNKVNHFASESDTMVNVMLEEDLLNCAYWLYFSFFQG